MQKATFGAGCFWGVEAAFRQLQGVISTSVGYTGGSLKNPTYENVCSGNTGHAEAVEVIYDPARISYEQLLQVFWENHDPTLGMRQGNDVGTQYRSGIYCHGPAQRTAAERSRDEYQKALTNAAHGTVTTEIMDAPAFYYAEEVHQQYLSKNPDGYCGLGGTGVSCPIGLATSQ